MEQRAGAAGGPSRPRSDRAVVGFRIRLDGATGRAVSPEA
jgi:hypothetical protein